MSRSLCSRNDIRFCSSGSKSRQCVSSFTQPESEGIWIGFSNQAALLSSRFGIIYSAPFLGLNWAKITPQHRRACWCQWTSNLLSALFMTNRGGRVMTVRLTKPYYSDVYAQMSRPTIRCEPVDHDLETTINVGTNWGLECTCCLLHFVALVNRLWDGPFWFAPEVPWTRTVLLSLASQSRDIISLPFIIDEARHINFFFVFFFFHILRLCATVCTCMLYGGQILQFLYCGQMVPLSSAVVFSISKMWWRGEDCSCHGQRHGRRR